LEQKGQKVGALRFANLDVKQLAGVAEMNVYALRSLGTTMESVEVSAGGGGGGRASKQFVPPPPIPQPEKITVSATVQCAFQIQ